MFGYSTTPSHFQQYHHHHRQSPHHPSPAYEDAPAGPSMNATTPSPAFIFNFLSSLCNEEEEVAHTPSQQVLHRPCGIQAHHHDVAPQYYTRQQPSPSTSVPTASSGFSLSDLKKQHEAYQAFDARRRATELQELEEKQALRRAEEERVFIAKLQAAAKAQAQAQAQAQAEAKAREEARALALAKAKAEAIAREQARLRAAYIAQIQAERQQQQQQEARREHARREQEKARAVAIARQRAAAAEQEQKQKASYFAHFLEQVRRQQAHAEAQANSEKEASEHQRKQAEQEKQQAIDTFAKEQASAQKLVDEWKREQAQTIKPVQKEGKPEPAQDKGKQRADETSKPAAEHKIKKEVSPEDVLKSFFAQFGIQVLQPTSQSPTSSATATASSSKAEEAKKDSQTSKPATPVKAFTPVTSSTPQQVRSTPVQQKKAESASSPATASPIASSANTAKKTSIVEKALQTALENEWNETAILNSLKALDGIKKRFETLKTAFVEPETLIFEHAEADNTSTPPLAFAPANRSIKEYDETLLRILTQLDEVESNGSDNVKRNRKELAVAIQGELDRIDSIKNQAWEKTLQKTAVDETAETKEEEVSQATSGDADQPQAVSPADESPAKPTDVTENTLSAPPVEPVTSSAEAVTAEQDTSAAAEAGTESSAKTNGDDTLHSLEASANTDAMKPKSSLPVSIEVTSESEPSSWSSIVVEEQALPSKAAEIQTIKSQSFEGGNQAVQPDTNEEQAAVTAENVENQDTNETGDVELAQSATLSRTEEDNHEIFEIESVSSQSSGEASNTKQEVHDTVAKYDSLEGFSETSSKATTISDEEDDNESEAASESSFEVL